MKKQPKKKEEKKQVIEIHIYVHNAPNPQQNPNGTGYWPPLNPPYIVTC